MLSLLGGNLAAMVGMAPLANSWRLHGHFAGNLLRVLLPLLLVQCFIWSTAFISRFYWSL
jgi:hypothetical protein